jgi:hypothetical protein
MNAGNRRRESEFQLSQFEPDPEGGGGCPDPGSPVEVLDWLTWIDAARELAWAEVEALQIIPRLPAL